MRYISASIACAILFTAFSASAAEPKAEPSKTPSQPYFMLHVKDCSLPVCEEQVVYMRADDQVKFLNPSRDQDSIIEPRASENHWAQARQGSFERVSQLARTLARTLPAKATCEKVRPERIQVSGHLVSGVKSVEFHFSDACANQSSGSMSYQLVREIREAMSLGVQQLLKG